MEMQKLIEIAGKIKSKQESRNIYMKHLQEEGLLKAYLICEEMSQNCWFLTKESEKELYCKALFNAFIWGKNIR